MAYIGTNAPTGFSTSAKDTFSGDNSTTAFTMSRGQSTANDVQVFVDNVRQEPVIAYNVSGATLTFTEAPPTGTNNIYCVHNSNQAVSVLPPADLGSRDYVFGDDISLKSDSAVINFGLDSEVTLTHNHNTGLDLNLAMTATTFEPDGDTSAGDSAAIGHTSAEGLILTGQGSTSDVTIKNDADVKVMAIPTGTRQVHIGDASANDSAIVFDGNAQDFHIGLDDSADDLVIGLGSTLGTTTHIAVTEDGHITKPLQPAFQVVKSGNQNNISNSGYETITFDTEVFDVGSNFASNTFTAPITGKYLLSTNVRLDNVDTGPSYYIIILQTSNRGYQVLFSPTYPSDPPYLNREITAVADMDANDTAYVRIFQNGGTSQTDIDDETRFFGYLLG